MLLKIAGNKCVANTRKNDSVTIITNNDIYKTEYILNKIQHNKIRIKTAN